MTDRLASRYQSPTLGASAADKAIEAAEREPRRAGKVLAPTPADAKRLRGIPVLLPPRRR